MRKVLAISAALTAAPLYAMGDLEMMTKANELGSVLASEQICGLSYDQAAIAAWIEGNIPPDAMGFASNLSLQTQGAAYMLNSLSPSARTAHCAAISQTARHYGFVK